MTQKAALIFDLDQTLFDRQHAWDRWIASVNVSHRDQIQLRQLDHNGLGDRNDFFAEFESITGGSINQMRFAVSLAQFIEPDPKLTLALEHLRNDYKLAILTNGGEATQDIKLQTLSIDHVIPSDCVFISSQIGFAKPDRRAFDYVAKELELAPADCMYFGDQMESDCLAARAAGWSACQVSGPVDLRHRLSQIVEAAVC